MRSIQIYKFNELSEEAKAIAISNHEEDMREGLAHEALEWAIDDCSLFEPLHKEMVELFGENYYDENLTPDGKYGQFVFKNTRKWIRTDSVGSYLFISEALEITNDRLFKLWLGIPEVLHKNFTYEFNDDGSRDFTTIDFFIEGLFDNPVEGVLSDLLEKAKEKFDSHVQTIAERVEQSYESYFSEDQVQENIEELDLEFFEDGTKYDK